MTLHAHLLDVADYKQLMVHLIFWVMQLSIKDFAASMGIDTSAFRYSNSYPFNSVYTCRKRCRAIVLMPKEECITNITKKRQVREEASKYAVIAQAVRVITLPLYVLNTHKSSMQLHL
ncbi:unnamed protein product [Albugo candida]|uniref:Uncharacterized protein n=1 Tax=Albugo candida TaxID=65357 RepID=A0A024GD08_9STRA|nr:unnamed protein product [Albugo candida]|eukprot:CCI44572.1 unnamed protein product [Albugo candida]